VVNSVRNRRLMRRLVVLALAMFAFGFALAPLYAAFCRVAGVNQLEGADRAPAGTPPDLSRTLLMQFDSNLRDGLPWAFRPLQRAVHIHPGELVRITYEVRNNSDRIIIGQAIPSYAPEGAAAYVRKLQCFCFSTQTLGPHEVRQMPVLFLIDSALPREVSTLTLSYTFFSVSGTSLAGRRPS
jgi:cytochrome c oxidase assembly protein subunit 11